MANDPSPTALSPRAGIAMLTLQLRSAVQEAETLEHTDHTIDEAAARRQLRERLDPLLAERSQAYAESLSMARAEADAALDAARSEAARRAAAAAVAAEAARSAAVDTLDLAKPIEVEPVVVPDPFVMIEPEPAIESESAVAIEPEPEPEPVMEIEPEPLPVVESTVPSTAVVRSAPQEITVSIDADAFARVFATVFAALLEQRGIGPAPQPYALGAYVQVPHGQGPQAQQVVYAPAPNAEQPRQSFWSHARHPDVLLMGLATVIVLVVLAAWLV